MIPDETLYRRYLGGDDEGLNALMERHGDRLTLYLDGCLYDIHEAETDDRGVRPPDHQGQQSEHTAQFQHTQRQRSLGVGQNRYGDY